MGYVLPFGEIADNDKSTLSDWNGHRLFRNLSSRQSHAPAMETNSRHSLISNCSFSPYAFYCYTYYECFVGNGHMPLLIMNVLLGMDICHYLLWRYCWEWTYAITYYKDVGNGHMPLLIIMMLGMDICHYLLWMFCWEWTYAITYYYCFVGNGHMPLLIMMLGMDICHYLLWMFCLEWTYAITYYKDVVRNRHIMICHIFIINVLLAMAFCHYLLWKFCWE